MKAPSTSQRVLIVLLAASLLALSATMAWATVNDYSSRGYVPSGVSVAGTDLSGLSEAQARDAIEKAVVAPLLRPVAVEGDGRTFYFDPRGTVSVDVDAMIAEAYAPRRTASYLARLGHDVIGTPFTKDVEPTYTVDEAAISTWLAGVADSVDRPSIDASLTVVGSTVKITKSRTGRSVDGTAAVDALSAAFATDKALADGARAVELPVKTLKPKVTEKSMGKTIVVDLSERSIRLYNGVKIEKKYSCAIGTPGYPTPQGQFEIVLKRFMPTWSNPAPNGWGKDMPAYIGPGPSNPLGTRALNINAAGIRFHGTTKRYSIGSAASHGCMRMLREDIEDFYERVEVGTPVHIVP
ncbi:MAG: L,D-transpeptidase/peptidoglycan binding protein [Coriobacteriia bacterium]|nr:L,D-transpeptidase/peptidoglycan binding protein [Coriobacteriia bacterium]